MGNKPNKKNDPSSTNKTEESATETKEEPEAKEIKEEPKEFSTVLDQVPNHKFTPPGEGVDHNVNPFKLAQLKEDRPLAVEAKDQVPYMIGVTPDSRKCAFTIGGQSFPLFFCKIGKTLSNTEESETPIRGAVIQLSEEQAEKLKGAVLRKGLRFLVGTVHTFTIPRNETYNFQNNEFPAAMFCYLWKVSDLQRVSPNGWREEMEIPTLMARSTKLVKAFGTGWKDTKGKFIPLIPDPSGDKLTETLSLT